LFQPLSFFKQEAEDDVAGADRGATDIQTEWDEVDEEKQEVDWEEADKDQESCTLPSLSVAVNSLVFTIFRCFPGGAFSPLRS